jgi:hypothetical protein
MLSDIDLSLRPSVSPTVIKSAKSGLECWNRALSIAQTRSKNRWRHKPRMVTAATNERTRTGRKERNKHAIFPAQLGAAFLGFLFGLHRLKPSTPVATMPPQSSVPFGTPWDMHRRRHDGATHQSVVSAWITHISDPPKILRD